MAALTLSLLVGCAPGESEPDGVTADSLPPREEPADAGPPLPSVVGTSNLCDVIDRAACVEGTTAVRFGTRAGRIALHEAAYSASCCTLRPSGLRSPTGVRGCWPRSTA